MDKEIEIFKVYADNRSKVNGCLWEVSNYGNVRKNGEEFLPYENSGKYLRFANYKFVHRAVAELFIPNPENKPTVDHINRNRQDNRACNLRWATYQEQADNTDIDAIRKSQIGNKHALGCRRSEESKAKMSAAKIGNKYKLGYIPSEETRAKLRAANLGRKHSEESKAKMRAAHIGHKNVLGRVWVTNPTTEKSTMIDPSELNDYFAKGYIKGRKAKK